MREMYKLHNEWINTLLVKSFWTVRLLMFVKEDSSVHQACIYLIQNKAKTVQFWNILLFKITIFYLNM